MAESYVNAGYWFTRSNPKLPLSNIDAKFFTHLFCGYVGLNPKTYEVAISDSDKIFIESFTTTVQIRNPKVKTLLSIGGEEAKVDRIAEMAAESAYRALFIKTSILAARAGDFDGLDLQWLYPSTQKEMDHLQALLSEWHSAVVKEAKDFHRTQLLLVATVFYSPYRGSILYPIGTIKQTLDWVNVVSYDIYTPTSSKLETGPSAAFYNPKNISLSASFGINTWIESGLPAKMIVFGIPFHGWAWKLASTEQHEVFSVADGAATETSDGPMEYWKITDFIKNNKVTIVELQAEYVIGYTYAGATWIAYENQTTITKKIQAAIESKLLGYFAWNIAGDDECNTLANAAMKEWEGAN